MIPGGRVSPRQMKMMMKRMGITTEDIDAKEVIIRTPSKDYIFKDANVTMVIVQGQKTFQIVGDPDIVQKQEEIKILEEDVKLVAEKAGVSEEEARKALEECGGEPAEAIIKLMSK